LRGREYRWWWVAEPGKRVKLFYEEGGAPVFTPLTIPVQEDNAMKIDEIRPLAAKKGIKAGRMKKVDLIRSIQKAEGNDQCFDTGMAQQCGQQDCLWREDCE
jgi:hypothetical protein